jgi:hypothetical protein
MAYHHLSKLKNEYVWGTKTSAPETCADDFLSDGNSTTWGIYRGYFVHLLVFQGYIQDIFIGQFMDKFLSILSICPHDYSKHVLILIIFPDVVSSCSSLPPFISYSKHLQTKPWFSSEIPHTLR